MAYNSGFFNSIDGDRKYNAEDMSNFYGQLIGNGVLSKEGASLQVTAGTGLSVNIAKGWAWINSHWFYNESELNLIVPTRANYDQYYSVVLRLYDGDQQDSRKIVPEMVEETTPTRTDVIYDLILAKVYVPANATNVAGSNITDTRADTNLCGWVTGLIEQVDTTSLFNQWQSAYDAFYTKYMTWFSELMDTLGIATYNQKYEVDAVSTTNQTTFSPNIGDYSATEKDILVVYVNGFRLIQNIDYTTNGVDGEGLVITFKNALSANNNIAVVVLKSQLGSYPDDVPAVAGGSGDTIIIHNNSLLAYAPTAVENGVESYTSYSTYTSDSDVEEE